MYRVRGSFQTTKEPLVLSLVQGLMQMIHGVDLNFKQIAIYLWGNGVKGSFPYESRGHNKDHLFFSIGS